RDTAFAALVDDLDSRDRLDSTLVWVNSEFGRTPRVNRAAGRDHWPWAYSLVLAGGGIAGGVCLGVTDAIAAYPTRDPHDPADLVATVYHLLGVPPATTVGDQFGRPHALVTGNPIATLLAGRSGGRSWRPLREDEFQAVTAAPVVADYSPIEPVRCPCELIGEVAELNPPALPSPCGSRVLLFQ